MKTTANSLFPIFVVVLRYAQEQQHRLPVLDDGDCAEGNQDQTSDQVERARVEREELSLSPNFWAKFWGFLIWIAQNFARQSGISKISEQFSQTHG